MFDLSRHPAPRKMLVVIPAQLGNVDRAREHLLFVWRELIQGPDDPPFAPVILQGTGLTPADEADRLLLIRALEWLGLI
jgi:hypothetical protein